MAPTASSPKVPAANLNPSQCAPRFLQMTPDPVIVETPPTPSLCRQGQHSVIARAVMAAPTATMSRTRSTCCNKEGADFLAPPDLHPIPSNTPTGTAPNSPRM